MIYLLDTDVMIFMLRGLKSNRRPEQRKRAETLLKRCRQAESGGHTIGLSAITVSELEFGAYHSGQYATEIAAVRKILSPFELYEYDPVMCPPHYGRIRHELESKGIPIGGMDMLITAQALALDATLISNNLAHFSRITDLKTVNWVS